MKQIEAIRSHIVGASSVIFAVVTLAGCAHMPDVTVHYYLAKSDVSFKVIRTVTCDQNNLVLVADAVTPTVVHSADREAASGIKSINLAALKGAMSDTDVRIEFYDDGRLKGFNGASAGQGEAILKSTVTFASAVLGFDGAPVPRPTECDAINKVGGGKPIALTYLGKIDVENDLDQTLEPEPVTKIIVEQYNLQPAIGYVCVTRIEKRTAAPRTAYVKKDNDIVLSFRDPGFAKFRVTAGGENSCQNDTIWEEYLTVAQFGETNILPVPSATTFGKRVMAASFSESGALSVAQFAAATGAGQALNVVMTATEGETTSEKANALKAEADLIAQMQRLMQCRTDPKNCK